MTKAFLLLVPALIASSSGDTHLAPVAGKPVKGTMSNLDPANQSKLDDKRRLRVAGATREYATEERGFMATGEDELKLLEQPLIAKLVGDPEDGVSTSMYSRVADWFGTGIWNQEVPKVKPIVDKVQIAKNMIWNGASHDELYNADITHKVHKDALYDDIVRFKIPKDELAQLTVRQKAYGLFSWKACVVVATRQ